MSSVVVVDATECKTHHLHSSVTFQEMSCQYDLFNGFVIQWCATVLQVQHTNWKGLTYRPTLIQYV